jgi:hypothetical protein
MAVVWPKALDVLARDSVIGILRLRKAFASRRLYAAQDDNFRKVVSSKNICCGNESAFAFPLNPRS